MKHKTKRFISLVVSVVILLVASVVGVTVNADRVDKRKAVVIADSYGGLDYTESDLYWILSDCYGVNVSQYDYYNGNGFNANRGEWASWVDKLERDFKNDSTVGQVVVVGGYNDINNPKYNNIYRNACDFIETAHRKFPNARIKFVCVGHKPSFDTSKDTYVEEGVKGLWYAATEQYSYAYYVWNADAILQDNEFWTDGVHPNNKGIYDIGSKVAFLINNDTTWFYLED